MQGINLEMFNRNISITFTIDHLEQVFFRVYLVKMFNLVNLKNLNMFAQKYLIFTPRYEKNTLAVTIFSMNKKPRKAIYTRIFFLYKYRKYSAGNLFSYKKISYSVKPPRKARKDFHNNNSKFSKTKFDRQESQRSADGDKLITFEKKVFTKLKDAL